MARAKKIVAVSGTAPKKGQLPAGLVRWLRENGRLARGGATMAKQVKRGKRSMA